MVGDPRLFDTTGWLIPIALLQGVATPTPHFAPPEDKPITYLLTSVRQDGPVSRQFRTHRRVTFRATATGYDADLELLDSSQQAGDDVGAMFQAAAMALAGERLHYHLDRQGRIIGIDNGDMIWDAFCRAIAQMDRGPGVVSSPRGRSATALAQALRATPPAARRAMLDSMLMPLIAPAEQSGAADRVVTVPVTTADGRSTILSGVERRSVGDQGVIDTETRAEGAIAAPASDDATPARLSYHRTILTDPATGLLVRRLEENTIAIGANSGAARTASTLTISRE